MSMGEEHLGWRESDSWTMLYTTILYDQEASLYMEKALASGKITPRIDWSSIDGSQCFQ